MFPVGISAEVIVHRASGSDGIKGGIGNDATDTSADHLILTTVNGGPLHTAHRMAGILMTGKRIKGFVIMVIAVERYEIQIRMFHYILKSHSVGHISIVGRRCRHA